MEVVLKHGEWGSSDARQEIELPVAAEYAYSAIDLAAALQWQYGIGIITHSTVYMYKGFEVTLVAANNSIYYYEIEITTTNKDEVETLKRKLRSIASEFSLKEFSENEFIDTCNAINESAVATFDFSSPQDRERAAQLLQETFTE